MVGAVWCSSIDARRAATRRSRRVVDVAKDTDALPTFEGSTWGLTATRTHASPKGDSRKTHFVASSQGAGHPNKGSSYLPLPNSPVRSTLPSAWKAPTNEESKDRCWTRNLFR